MSKVAHCPNCQATAERHCPGSATCDWVVCVRCDRVTDGRGRHFAAHHIRGKTV